MLDVSREKIDAIKSQIRRQEIRRLTSNWSAWRASPLFPPGYE